MDTAEKPKKAFGKRAAGIVYLTCLVLCVCAVLFFSLRTEAAKIYSYNVTYRGETTEHIREVEDAEAVLDEMGIDRDSIIYTVESDGSVINITVTDLYLVSVTEAGSTAFYTVEAGTTLSQVFAANGISVDSDDRVTLPLDTVIGSDSDVSISRVSVEFIHKETPIPHGTERVANASMEKGKTNIKTAGSDGVKLITYKSVYVDGILESYDLDGEETVTEPVTEVVEYGTKEKKAASSTTKKPSSNSSSNKKPSSNSSSNSSNKKPTSTQPSYYKGSSDKYKDNGDGTVTTFSGKVLKYSKVLNIKASAYTYMNNKMDITASGVPVQVGVVAAHKNTIPMGTKVYIVGKYGTWEYGIATVGDTGCAAGKVDLFMRSYDECMDFGVRGATVYILED